jgi:hypothetical protein
MDGYRHHLLRGSRNGGFRKSLDQLEMTRTALFSFEGTNLTSEFDARVRLGNGGALSLGSLKTV